MIHSELEPQNVDAFSASSSRRVALYFQSEPRNLTEYLSKVPCARAMDDLPWGWGYLP
jgi:hypothetical protein